MAQQIDIDQSVSVSTLAAEKIRQMRTARGLSEEVGLRLFISGGGCSGFQYGMAFDPNPVDGDTIFQGEGLSVIVDPGSLPYLLGAHIDYIDTMMGGGFKVENPNAVSTCGCGNSFRSKGEDAASEGDSCGCGGGSCGSH